MLEAPVRRNRIGPRLHGVCGDPEIVRGNRTVFARSEAVIDFHKQANVSPTVSRLRQSGKRAAHLT